MQLEVRLFIFKLKLYLTLEVLPITFVSVVLYNNIKPDIPHQIQFQPDETSHASYFL